MNLIHASSSNPLLVVTGAAGFIGSNIIKGLNARGLSRIIAVDDLTQGDKFKNIADLHIADYWDVKDFYARFGQSYFGKIEAVFHEGACSDTMNTDGRYMMNNNYNLSFNLFQDCQKNNTRLLYASSAAVYGAHTQFTELPHCELPLNVYGYSKLLFDQRMRLELGDNFERIASDHRAQVVGFRYFNVYGPREQHKGRMASVAFHQFHQFLKNKTVQLFGAYNNYAAGEQMRDFVYVDDVVAVNLWFFDNPDKSGIFNLGTGHAQPFNDIALTTINTLRSFETLPPLSLSTCVEQGLLTYTEFPEALKGKYQSYTQADLSQLRAIGCNHLFQNVQSGVSQYVQWLWNFS